MSETRFAKHFFQEQGVEYTPEKAWAYELALLDSAEKEFHSQHHELGRGQAGVVWYGEAPEFGQDVCFKTIHTVGSETNGLDREFDYHQGFYQAGVRVPELIAHISGNPKNGFGQDGLLAMEHVHGRNLEEELTFRETNQHPFQANEFQGIIHDASRQIELAHQKNLYHRDLTMRNIMLNEDGQVVLIDFGRAIRRIGGEDELTLHQATVIEHGHQISKQLARDDQFLGQFSREVLKRGLVLKP